MFLYNEKLHSYKEFPLKVAELGLVHRHEMSGVTYGLFRVRRFTQDDAHIFITDEQIKDEVIDIIKLVGRIYKQFGFTYSVEISTRPEKSIGTKEQWDYAEDSLKKALKELKLDFKLNESQGAFYGPKIDFHIKDAIARTWQCGTIQLDMAMPERFDLTYEGKDGKKHRPVMLHRAIYGSLERFIGILIEHYAGQFPLWLSPVQVILLTITDAQKEYVKKLSQKLKELDIRVEIDTRNESMSKKVRDAQLNYIPYILTIGDREIQNKELAVRTLDGKIKTEKINLFIERILKEIKERK